MCLSLINCSSDIKKESFPLSNACDPSAGLCATSASVASGWMCVFMTRCQARGMQGKRKKERGAVRVVSPLMFTWMELYGCVVL